MLQAFIQSLEPRRLLASVGADLNYGERGLTASLDREYGDVNPKQLIDVDAQGRLIVLRELINGAALRRFTAEGQVDPTFDRQLLNGTRGGAGAVDRTGGVIVGVHIDIDGHADFAPYRLRLLRFDANAHRDLNFGRIGRGQAAIEYPQPLAGYSLTPREVLSVTVDQSDRIYVAASATPAGQTDAFNDNNAFFVISRFNRTGQLDTSYGESGHVALRIDSATSAFPVNAARLQLADDHSRLYALLQRGGDVEAFALDSLGALDNAFGTSGRVQIPLDARLYARSGNTARFGIIANIDSFGRTYYVVNPRYYEGVLQVPPSSVILNAVYRIDSNGDIDATWGGGGVVDLNRISPVGRFGAGSINYDRANHRVYIGGDSIFCLSMSDGSSVTAFDFDGVANMPNGAPDFMFSIPGIISASDTDDPNAIFVAGSFGNITRMATQSSYLDTEGVLRVFVNDVGVSVRIEPHRASGRLRLAVNHHVQTFDPRAVTSIVARLSDGNDRFVCTYDLPCEINAEYGNDYLQSFGTTVYRTGLGNDTVVAGDAKDTVFNDAGHDVLSLGAGNARVFANGANASADVIAMPKPGQTASISTGSGSDTIHISGGGYAYVSDTGGPVNRIAVASTPAAPAVIITGASGRTFVSTGDGNDTINAGYGRDQIDSGAGNDRITKLAGPGYINAGDGDDDISGGAGDDTILGGRGNDILRGNGGNDSLDGGRGNDRLFGNEGIDTLFGGRGDDTAIHALDDDDDQYDGIESILID